MSKKILSQEVVAKFSCEDENVLVDVYQKTIFIFKKEGSVFNDTETVVKKVAERIAKWDDDNREHYIVYKKNCYTVNNFETEI